MSYPATWSSLISLISCKILHLTFGIYNFYNHPLIIHSITAPIHIARAQSRWCFEYFLLTDSSPSLYFLLFVNLHYLFLYCHYHRLYFHYLFWTGAVYQNLTYWTINCIEEPEIKSGRYTIHHTNTHTS